MGKLQILVLGILALVFFSPDLYAQSRGKRETSEKIKAAESVQVYYFHYTRRCKTCNAVESQTKKALQELYAKQMQAGKITFASVNLEEPEGKRIGDSIGVKSQSLLVVSGDQQYDLTDKAFLYATTNPDKLKLELQKAIGKR